MIDIFNGFFKGKKVLVTGHTGFKGSWLCIWLHELGAAVVGVGLDPYSERDNFVLSGIGNKIEADNLYIATDDGSEGTKGLVTQVVERLVGEEGQHYDVSNYCRSGEQVVQACT